MQARVVSAGRGARWLAEGWRLFRVAPLAWLAAVFGYWLLMNGQFWSSLPEAHKKVVADTFDAQALEQRKANQKLDSSLEATLKKQGLEFASPDTTPFQKALTQSGFYKTWKEKFGAPLWTALESVTGQLA